MVVVPSGSGSGSSSSKTFLQLGLKSSVYMLVSPRPIMNKEKKRTTTKKYLINNTRNTLNSNCNLLLMSGQVWLRGKTYKLTLPRKC